MVFVCLSSCPSHPALHAQLDQEAGGPGRTRLLGFSPRQHVCLPQRGPRASVPWWSTPVASCPGAQRWPPEFEAERGQQVHGDKRCC